MTLQTSKNEIKGSDMSNAINELFCVMRVVNTSNEPLCPEQIVAKTWLNLTAVRLYAKRLYEEGLIEIATLREDGHHYYMRKGLRT